MANILEIILRADDQASSVLEKFGNFLKTAGILAFAKEVGEAAWELGQLGLQTQAVEARFQAFAGGAENANAILSKIRETTGGTISEFDAMQNATRLMSMGLSSSADETANLINMALRLGNQTEDAGARIENFSLLLANQSIPRLDSFGISGAKVRDRIAELQEATPGLSREVAFMTAVMEQGAVAMETLGDAGIEATQNSDSLRAALGDLKSEMGQSLAPAVNEASGALGNFARKLSDNIAVSNEAREAGKTYFDTITETNMATREARRAQTEFVNEIELIKSETASAAERMDQYNMAIGMADAAAQEAAAANREAAIAQKEWNDAFGFTRDIADDSVVSFEQYNAAIANSYEVSVNAAIAQKELEAVLIQNTIAADAAAAALGEMSQAQLANTQIEILRESMEAGTISAQEFATAQTYLLAQSGQLTVAEQNANAQIASLRDKFIAGKISAAEFAAGIDRVKSSLDEVQDKTVTFTVQQRIETVGQAAAVSGGLSAQEMSGIIGGGAGFQGGGAFTVPPGYPGDTFPMRVSSGERVIVIPRDNTNNFNLTVNSAQAAASVVQDFNFMRAFAR